MVSTKEAVKNEQKKQKTWHLQKTSNKMVDISPTIWVIMLNMNGLNSKGKNYLTGFKKNSKIQILGVYKKHTLDETGWM